MINLSSSFNDLELSDSITVVGQSRNLVIENKRFDHNSIIVDSLASHIKVRNCYINFGGIRLHGGAFHCSLEDCWIDNALEDGIHIGDGAGIAGCANLIKNVHVRWAGNWGFLIQNQVAFSLISSSADANGSGGILASSSHGSYISPSAESNPIGMRFYDCLGFLSGENLRDNPTPLIIDGGSFIKRG